MKSEFDGRILEFDSSIVSPDGTVPEPKSYLAQTVPRALGLSGISSFAGGAEFTAMPTGGLDDTEFNATMGRITRSTAEIYERLDAEHASR